eukprot:CAMPEP_0170524670 /NCGR_PEP_ID=MMETSP0209-20121228/10162_1 /TAXON_ID=665100 ORGANISM="Litonotus pictus, Strain P1" /NCGR_SAMPLE_ID=MMETSP0209 /ASSEMBLY_ACC=CAM_ASM_000301 /LENGTH=1368 /DNA_ID=CAMNT_0010813517 /DNA_START=24 /DNA_END=4130 /DNA_ORIENTATION=+
MKTQNNKGNRNSRQSEGQDQEENRQPNNRGESQRPQNERSRLSSIGDQLSRQQRRPTTNDEKIEQPPQRSNVYSPLRTLRSESEQGLRPDKSRVSQFVEKKSYKNMDNYNYDFDSVKAVDQANYGQGKGLFNNNNKLSQQAIMDINKSYIYLSQNINYMQFKKQFSQFKESLSSSIKNIKAFHNNNPSLASSFLENKKVFNFLSNTSSSEAEDIEEKKHLMKGEAYNKATNYYNSLINHNDSKIYSILSLTQLQLSEKVESRSPFMKAPLDKTLTNTVFKLQDESNFLFALEVFIMNKDYKKLDHLIRILEDFSNHYPHQIHCILNLTKLSAINKLVDNPSNLNSENLIRYLNLVILRLKAYIDEHNSHPEEDMNSRLPVKHSIYEHIEILRELKVENIFSFGFQERSHIANSLDSNKDNLLSLLKNYCSIKAELISFDNNIERIKYNSIHSIQYLASDETLAKVASLYLSDENSIQNVLSLNRKLGSSNFLSNLIERIHHIQNKENIPLGVCLDSIERAFYHIKNVVLNTQETVSYLQEEEIHFVCELIRVNMSMSSSKNSFFNHCLELYSEVMNSWKALTNSKASSFFFQANNSLLTLSKPKAKDQTQSSTFDLVSENLLSLNQSKDKLDPNSIKLSQLQSTFLALSYFKDNSFKQGAKFYKDAFTNNLKAIKKQEEALLKFYESTLNPSHLNESSTKLKNSLFINEKVNSLGIEKRFELYQTLRQTVFDRLELESGLELTNFKHEVSAVLEAINSKFFAEEKEGNDNEKSPETGNADPQDQQGQHRTSLRKNSLTKKNTPEKQSTVYSSLLEQLSTLTEQFINKCESDKRKELREEIYSNLKVLYYNSPFRIQSEINFTIERIFDKLQEGGVRIISGSTRTSVLDQLDGKSDSIKAKDPLFSITESFPTEEKPGICLSDLKALEITQKEKDQILSNIVKEVSMTQYTTLKEVLMRLSELVEITETVEEEFPSIGEFKDLSFQESAEKFVDSNSKGAELSGESKDQVKFYVEEVNRAVESKDYDYVEELLNKFEEYINKLAYSSFIKGVHNLNLKSKLNLFSSFPSLSNASLLKHDSISNDRKFVYSIELLKTALKQGRLNYKGSNSPLYRRLSIINFYIKQKNLPSLVKSYFNIDSILNYADRIEPLRKELSIFTENNKSIIAKHNMEVGKQELMNAFKEIDDCFYKLTGMNREASILLGFMKDNSNLSNQEKLDSAKSLLQEKIPYIDLSLANQMILFGVTNDSPSAIKLGEYTYTQVGGKIPDWLQFKVNQYILNNGVKYNSAISPVKNMNLASIYNKPNADNSVESVSEELSEEEKIGNSSIYVVDHLKLKGLEKKYARQLDKIERINSMTKQKLLTFNYTH